MATESDGYDDAFVESVISAKAKGDIPPGSFYIKCSCSEKFVGFDSYDFHRSKGRSDCRSSPVLKQRPNASNNPFSKSNISSEKQLGAFFGDLDHKREIINKYQKLGNETQSFFDNRHQAWYVKKFFPEYIVRAPNSQAPSDKTVGTIFEYLFHTLVTFRFAYLRWLPNKLDFAPFEDRELVPDREVLDLGASTEVNIDPIIRELVDGKVKVEDFMLPISQIDPMTTLPPGDPLKIYAWANAEKFWRKYPELMGYNRQEAFVTAGDVYPWMISSICRYDGLGCLAIGFPAVRSPFDGEEHNPSLGQLDGLSHWQWADKIQGFNITLHSMSEMTHFIDDRYKDTRYDSEIPFDILGKKTYVMFRGTPGRRSYFMLQRFVLWNDTQPHMPRPDSPGPGEHPDLVVPLSEE